MQSQTQLVYEAKGWEVDAVRRELRLRGASVPVGMRAFEVLEALVKSAGQVVTKDDLMEQVWPGAIVEENTLAVHISAIRKALGPDRGLLKTHARRGYRLLGNWAVRRHDAARPPIGFQRMRVGGGSPVTNFPATVTRLVGRTAAVAWLRDFISAYRAVTLTGPGGVGKTSLALKVARGLVQEFADGAWFVELASLSEPALVPTAAAAALRLPTGFNGDTPETVARAVGDKKLLLVLDNCEHLVGPAARLAETLLVRCPHITILATSREILGIQGEYVYRVPPLEVPAPDLHDADHILSHSAVALFVARTKELGADFSPSPADSANIGAICRHLDGLPLAIEFAAAQAAAIGIQLVAARLHDRFALLRRGRRTALPRHRTLRGALDWSYELLSEPEQRLLRHLAIFSGGFSIAAVAAVLNDSLVESSSVMDGIANLVTKSLVALNRDRPPRWHLLETIRAYGLEKLDGHGERDTAARRHATYFRDFFSPPALTLSADERTGRVPELDNVRAALDWCFSAGGDTAVGVDLAAGSADWFRLDVGTSMLDTMRNARQSRDLLIKALDTAEALDDLDAQQRALVGVIIRNSFCAEHDKTRRAAERLLQVVERIGNAAAKRHAQGLMGCALVMVGRPTQAQEFLQKCLNVDRSMPDQSPWSGVMAAYSGVTQAFISRAFWLLGFIDQARLAAQASLDALPVAYDPLLLCRVLSFGMCRIVPTTGDFAAAEQNIARLVEAATRINAPFWQIAGRFFSGKLMIERGEFAQGVTVLNDAFDACRQTGLRIWYPEFKGALATGLAGLGQLDEALASVNEGLDDVVQDEGGHDLFFAELLRIKGDILLRRGAVAGAEDSFRAAIDIAREQDALFWELRAALSLARVRVTRGRGGEARQLLASVYDRFTEGLEAPDLSAAKAFLDELSG